MPAIASSTTPFPRLAQPPCAPVTPVTFLPAVDTDDLLARYWLRQVTVRLRRDDSTLDQAIILGSDNL